MGKNVDSDKVPMNSGIFMRRTGRYGIIKRAHWHASNILDSPCFIM
jgi:hypothetical protein